MQMKSGHEIIHESIDRMIKEPDAEINQLAGLRLWQCGLVIYSLKDEARQRLPTSYMWLERCQAV